MAIEYVIPWTSYYSLGSLVYSILAEVFGLPDPLSLFLSLFDGRQKMQATADIAGELNKYSSPTIKLLALGAAQLVHLDIPISSPDAAPHFGPFFRAALNIECGIRWSRRDASVEHAEDGTLTALLHEAGNPGVAGTATLQAVQTAYLHFLAGQWPGGSSPLQYFTTMAQTTGTDPASLMEKGWANQYVGNIAPPPPPPPPPPPGQHPITVDIQQHQTVRGTVHLLGYALTSIKNLVWLVDFQQVLSGFSGDWNSASVADGAHTLTVNGQDVAGHVVASLTITFNVNNHGQPIGSGNIHFNFSYGQEVSGTYSIEVTVEGGPFPEAHITLIDNGSQLAQIPDGTTTATTPRTFSYQWNTRNVANGLHTIKGQWTGHLGTVHASLTSLLSVQNEVTPPPPPPPPVFEIPWTDWFKVCAETPNCAHLSNDYLALAQSVSNIAYAVYNLPKLWSAQPPDPCCDKVIAAFTSLTVGLNTGLHNLANAPSPAVLEGPIKEIAAALEAINHALGGLNPDFAGLGKELDRFLGPLKEIADKTCCPDLKPIIDVLKQMRADDQVPEPWIRALIESGAIPPDFVQLVQGTGWRQIAAEAWHILWWLLGIGATPGHYASKRLWDHLSPSLLNFIQMVWTQIIPELEVQLGPLLSKGESLAALLLKDLDIIVSGLFGFGISGVMEAFEAGLEGIDTQTEAGAKHATRLLLARSLEMGTLAHLVANIGELVPTFKTLGLNQTAAFIAEFAGFREVLINTHRPLLYSKLGRPAAQVFNRKFPTTLPGTGDAMGWWARRLLSDADAKHVAASAGFADHWDPTMFRAAYHPISPRALATLMQDQPFDRVQMREILQDNSYAPAHVDFMLDELEYASTKNVRNSYVSEALAAYQRGVMPDAELNAILEDLGWSGQAKKFVHARALLARRVTLAQKVEAQVTQLVAQGLLEPETGLRHLEAAGIQNWYANLEITLATTKAELIAARKAASEELRAEHARERNLTHAAVAEYEAGRVNELGLSTALKLIGIDPTLQASIVAVEEAKRAGRLKFLHGQLLQPADAAVLADQIGAIEQQFKDRLIDLASVRAQLHALKVPAAEQHALIARWAGSLKKTPGAALLVDPITGSLETHVT